MGMARRQLDQGAGVPGRSGLVVRNVPAHVGLVLTLTCAGTGGESVSICPTAVGGTMDLK